MYLLPSGQYWYVHICRFLTNFHLVRTTPPGLVNPKCASTIGNGVLRVTPSIQLDTLQEYRAYRRIHNSAYSAGVHQLFEHDIFACADVPVHLGFDWEGGVVTQGDIEQAPGQAR